MDEEKIKIIELLKKNGEMSQTEISSNLTKNYYKIREMLEELEAEGKITHSKLGVYTFWRIKNG